MENEEITVEQAPDMMKSYKSDCLRLGAFLTVIMLIHILASGLAPLVAPLLADMSSTAGYTLSLMYSGLFAQIIPSLLAAVMLKYGLKNMCGGFHAPKQAKKAFANFPAIYGTGMTVNLVTMGIMLLISGGKTDISDSVNSTGLQPPDLVSSLPLFIMLTVIAPFFEEFIFRGAVLHLLKPYGSGIAVFVSAFCFGAYHGNLNQFFYAFALGILLGYITCATGSIFCSTVIHAMFNAVSGIIMMFISTPAVQKKALDPTAQLSDGESLVITFYAIFMIIVLLTAVIGFISMLKKLKQIKKYRLPKVWGEVSNKKKMAVMLLTVPVIISLLLMIDITAPNFLEGLVSDFAERFAA